MNSQHVFDCMHYMHRFLYKCECTCSLVSYFGTLDNYTNKMSINKFSHGIIQKKTCACGMFDVCYYARIMNHIAGEHERRKIVTTTCYCLGVIQIFIYGTARFRLANVHRYLTCNWPYIVKDSSKQEANFMMWCKHSIM